MENQQNQATDKVKIPTKYLPKGWKDTAMKKFDLSKNMIEKVAYGLSKNQEVFDYLLQLAEKGKQEQLLREERVNALQQ